MNLKNQRPVMVPDRFWRDLEKFPKAKLMDMVWDLACRTSGGDELNGPAIMSEINSTAEIVQNYIDMDKLERKNSAA